MLNVSLEHSFNAYKISLNVSKKEVVMFNPPKKQLDHELKIKLNGKNLYQTESNILEFIYSK